MIYAKQQKKNTAIVYNNRVSCLAYVCLNDAD